MESLILCQKRKENLKSLGGDKKREKISRWGKKSGKSLERISRKSNSVTFKIHNKLLIYNLTNNQWT